MIPNEPLCILEATYFPFECAILAHWLSDLKSC